jgi:hypothetical protein
MANLYEFPDPHFRIALRKLLADYVASVLSSNLSPHTKATYIDMANNFVRWTEGDFVPGSRKSA